MYRTFWLAAFVALGVPVGQAQAQQPGVLPGTVIQPNYPHASMLPAQVGLPVSQAPGGGPGGWTAPDPTPIHQSGPGPDPSLSPPPVPPYAWPTFAPYNNYSRVAYPTLYPHEQFPFIGPMYPFPKVPPGWRAVTLRWQDGYWWYGRTACGHDWWRIRYW